MAVEFGTGNIVYKETIAAPVEGVGHFEPLRHYAEVHLLLEPGERGSGLQFFTAANEDQLDRNWQRLILTHLEEKEHLGVLTDHPSPICRSHFSPGGHIRSIRKAEISGRRPTVLCARASRKQRQFFWNPITASGLRFRQKM